MQPGSVAQCGLRTNPSSTKESSIYNLSSNNVDSVCASYMQLLCQRLARALRYFDCFFMPFDASYAPLNGRKRTRRIARTEVVTKRLSTNRVQLALSYQSPALCSLSLQSDRYHTLTVHREQLQVSMLKQSCSY
jgi:hypothetical protein